ncbi:hypothetical protein B0A48_03913 [Cryoendolithus antarcticus]|uniref:Uncharacterized protein n=1 Tax=Cryoendolithus antarcticus TaxID=1507870 RepID=A0A1V8TGX1_9PEZI|nr:hypothetical protein B0A48_03913 [Cryoendolithus antarcticus]
MENGTGTTSGGSDDRLEKAGAVFDEQNTEDGETPRKGESLPPNGMKLSWSVQASPTSDTAPQSPSSGTPVGHRRTVSGSILAKLNFLRPSNDNARPPSRDKTPTKRVGPKEASPRNEEDIAVISPIREAPAMTDAMRLSKTVRKRKGSLRKAALLAGKRMGSERRERRNSLLPRSPTKQTALPAWSPPSPHIKEPEPEAESSPVVEEQSGPHIIKRQFSYEEHHAAVPEKWLESVAADAPAVTAARLALVTEYTKIRGTTDEATKSDALSSTASSPVDLKSPTSQAASVSTTSDEEPLTFDRPAMKTVLPPILKPASSSTSYFPPSSSLHPQSAASKTSSRHRSSPHRPSPLTHAPLPYPPSPPPEPHDYTETAYWGWVILALTWITFTVGMGSCLEVWSWAWDVGETPYAPPELEDDPTLPIVGYYPALMVLTGVVAWVWITIAWVGMKYFRHARVEV